MTESSPSPALPAKPPTFWEDLIDIFFQPAAVFRRRQNSNPWPILLFVAIVTAVITYVTYDTLLPIIDAEFTRTAARAMAKNPQITQEQMDKSRAMFEPVGRYAAGVFILFFMFVTGCLTWLLGRVVGSRQTFGAAIVVAGWSYMPRVVSAVVNAVQGLIMDPTKLTSMQSISFSPARFMDPETANPVLVALLARLDLFTIWVTVLLAIGLYATGKVSKERAVIFGFLIWVVGSLPALRTAFVSM